MTPKGKAGALEHSTGMAGVGKRSLSYPVV